MTAGDLCSRILKAMNGPISNVIVTLSFDVTLEESVKNLAYIVTVALFNTMKKKTKLLVIRLRDVVRGPLRPNTLYRCWRGRQKTSRTTSIHLSFPLRRRRSVGP